jgi:hypothetical protein
MVRGSNPKSQKYRHDPETVAKPVTEKRHTAKDGPHEGLVVDEHGQPVQIDGKKVHGDYDMQGVYQKQPDGSHKQIDTNEPGYADKMNEDVTPDKPMFQHGANDDYTKKGPDGSKVMGRQPDPGEKYFIAEPDGTTKVAENTAQLSNYYQQQGIPWPYN